MASCRAGFRRAASCRAGFCRAVSCCAVSYREASCRAGFRRAASCRAGFRRAASCPVASCPAGFCRAASCRAASCHAASIASISGNLSWKVFPGFTPANFSSTSLAFTTCSILRGVPLSRCSSNFIKKIAWIGFVVVALRWCSSHLHGTSRQFDQSDQPIRLTNPRRVQDPVVRFKF